MSCSANKKKYVKNHIGGELIYDMVLSKETISRIKKEEIKKFVNSFFNHFTEIHKETENFFIFPNNAVTYIAVLSESHIAIHTYPEIDFISFDIYFCSINKKLFKKIEKYIENWFKPIEKNVKIIKRGIKENK